MSPESPFREPGTCLKALSQGPVQAALCGSQARLSPQLPPHTADGEPRLREASRQPWSGRAGRAQACLF